MGRGYPHLRTRPDVTKLYHREVEKKAPQIRFILIALATAWGGGLLPGCASVGEQQSMAEYLDDSALTRQVQSRLLSDARVRSIAITVETIGRVVVLTGAVQTQAEKSHAEGVVRATPGVNAVRNNLVIRP